MLLNRRQLLRFGLASTALSTLPVLVLSGPAQAGATVPIGPDQALQTLLDGNQRFVAGQPARPHQSPGRVADVAESQAPFAVILSCADSRVPPEIIFDQGLGDLFVLRVAGNITSNEIIGSIEYAVAHFATPLILVLGHQRCGAVQATAEAVESGGEIPGQIASLVDAITPAVVSVHGQPGDLVDNAIRANVGQQIQRLQQSPPILTSAFASGNLSIAGAYYSLDSGAVTMINGGR